MATDTLESLSKRIATTRKLRSIVRTMRSLSAVSIRQYDQAVVALRDYNRTVELGLQVVLQSKNPLISETETHDGLIIAIVFGSDHGLCGRFNRQISQFARRELRRRGGENARYFAVGARASAHLEADGERVEESFLLPGSVEGLAETAHELLLRIDKWRTAENVTRVLVFHNMRTDGARASPHSVQLLPLAGGWLRHLTQRRWHSRTIPTYTMDTEALFSALVRQYLFAGLFRAGAESAASEHSARLAAMQAAEHNIKEHLEEMNAAYRRKRQDSITEELLDIVAGFEALATTENST